MINSGRRNLVLFEFQSIRPCLSLWRTSAPQDFLPLQSSRPYPSFCLGRQDIKTLTQNKGWLGDRFCQTGQLFKVGSFCPGQELMELSHERGFTLLHTVKEATKWDKTGLSSIIRVYGKEIKKLVMAPGSQWILAPVVKMKEGGAGREEQRTKEPRSE